MILTIPIDKFNIENIYFGDYIKNIVIENSLFIRLFYSTELFTINGVYISFPIVMKTIEHHFKNKFTCSFSYHENKDVFEKIKTIESNILKKIHIDKKSMEHCISNQFKSGFIKIFDNKKDHNKIIMFNCKISGIWEQSNSYGLTYKLSPL
tara:strand:+ start:1057 stop:1509 length:453 start_codon:yes stop_codon:yes gene_type:complete